MTRSVHVIGNVMLDVLVSPVLALPPPGGDAVVDRIAVRPAGAAGNVSLALAALGVKHRLFGVVGDDQAGVWVADALHRAGVGDDLRTKPGQATGISVALEAPGRERGFLTAHGVLADYREDDVPMEASTADLVVLTGYFSLPGLRGRGAKRVLERARAHGAVTILDTGWDPDDWRGHAVEEVIELLPLVDVFVPNEPEARALSGAATAQEAAERLQAHVTGDLQDGGAGWVVVTLGEGGLVASGAGGAQVRIPAPPVEAVDTTGAGDSLVAGILADLAVGGEMPEALATGVRVASTVVGRPSLHRYPSREELLPLGPSDRDDPSAPPATS